MKNDAVQNSFLKRHFLLFATFFLVGIFLFSQLSASAQQKSISGSVIGDDKAPIPGASIVVKGTTTGTVTDFNGKFSMKIPSTANTLIFSFVGLTSKEVTIGNGTVFNVILSESRTGVEEVVVVGYELKRKRAWLAQLHR